MAIVAIIGIVLIVVVVVLLPLGVFRRCRQIDAVRSRKLRESYAAAAEDVHAGEQSWEWRFDAYQSVPTFEMVWKVWRPVSSFYEDQRTGTQKDHIVS